MWSFVWPVLAISSHLSLIIKYVLSNLTFSFPSKMDEFQIFLKLKFVLNNKTQDKTVDTN